MSKFNNIKNIVFQLFISILILIEWCRFKSMPKYVVNCDNRSKAKSKNSHSHKRVHFTPATRHACAIMFLNSFFTVALLFILMLLHYYTIDTVIIITIFPDSCVSSYRPPYRYHTRINFDVRLFIILINIGISKLLFLILFLYHYCTPVHDKKQFIII